MSTEFNSKENVKQNTKRRIVMLEESRNAIQSISTLVKIAQTLPGDVVVLGGRKVNVSDNINGAMDAIRYASGILYENAITIAAVLENYQDHA